MFGWVDEERFSQAGFSPDLYVQETFNENSANDCELVVRELREKKASLAGQMVSNVQKNYHRFSETAREAGEIEAELANLRGLFVEWNSCLNAAKATKFQFDKQRRHKSEQHKAEDSRKKDANLAFVSDVELELAVLLSERRLEAAVALIEQQSKSRSPLAGPLVQQVVSALTLQLSSSALSIQVHLDCVDGMCSSVVKPLFSLPCRRHVRW
jgi:hypothetical protein